MDLTIILLPIHGVDDSSIYSLANEMDVMVERLGLHLDRDFNIPIKTSWKMYLFGNEFVSPQLAPAIGVFIQQYQWDYFSFYKIVWEKDRFRYYVAPRIFKSGTQMHTVDSLMPVDINSLNGVIILNDFLRNLEDVANTGAVSCR